LQGPKADRQPLDSRLLLRSCKPSGANTMPSPYSIPDLLEQICENQLALDAPNALQIAHAKKGQPFG
jgi:hypothetical protein